MPSTRLYEGGVMRAPALPESGFRHYTLGSCMHALPAHVAHSPGHRISEAVSMERIQAVEQLFPRQSRLGCARTALPGLCNTRSLVGLGGGREGGCLGKEQQ